MINPVNSRYDLFHNSLQKYIAVSSQIMFRVSRSFCSDHHSVLSLKIRCEGILSEPFDVKIFVCPFFKKMHSYIFEYRNNCALVYILDPQYTWNMWYSMVLFFSFFFLSLCQIFRIVLLSYEILDMPPM